ncbi:MAG: sugar ABC transporter ATP-binding protein, partial [Bacteroidota bacterium]
MQIIENSILKVNNLAKSFGGVKALDNIEFDLQKGEVHALMGENGAGKSTFMKIIMGLIIADSGSIFFEGQNLRDSNVKEILNKGISMIHQEILAVPELTVAQNIFLGRESGRDFWINENNIVEKSNDLLRKLGIQLNSQSKIKHLSIAEKQMVEIARAVSNQAKIIIMDEPTSSFSANEVSKLFKIINDLKFQGVSIIYISHKLDEIYEIADRITVLRDGKYITTQKTNNLERHQLISLMVGREIDDFFPKIENLKSDSKPILSVKNLTKKGKFESISFEVFPNEVLGVAGLIGAGRTEIIRALYGLDSFDSGQIAIDDKKVAINSPKKAISYGIGYVGEDRKLDGFIPDLSIKDNLSLSNLFNYSKIGLVQSDKEKTATSKIAADLHIKSNINQKLVSLSGGNQQKVVIGRVLLVSPKIIILDEPTRGIDV